MASKIIVSVFVVACLFPYCQSWVLLDGNAYEYKDGEQIRLSLKNDTEDITHRMILKPIVIAPRSRLSFQLLDIPAAVSFILAQVHSYKYNVTLSYDKNLLYSTYVNGSNIGLVKWNTIMPPHNMQFYIINHNQIQVMCLLAFEAYLDYDPVPGGCNQEFSVEIAPFLLLSYDNAVVTMSMQPAAYTAHDDECNAFPPLVQLEVYHMYLPERDFTSETYFNAIKSMMTPESMVKSGTLVPSSFEYSPYKRIHGAYPGTGSVYGVIARTQYGRVAAYVPAVTFACGNGLNQYDDCEIFTTPFSEILSASMLFIGIFICLCGHRKFVIGSIMVSFLWGTVISCMILGINIGTGYAIDILGVLTGFGFALVWWFLWMCCGIPIVAALLSTMALGFLLASAIMFAGLGNAISWMADDVSFWSLFICITGTVPILFSYAMHVGNIVACATLGAFVFVAPIDHYVGSNLRYIFLNTMRRAIYSDFRLAAIDPPFEITDLLLILAWLTLAMAGTVMQLYLQRNRAPFPPRRAWCVSSADAPSPSSSTGSEPLHVVLLRATMARGRGGRAGGTERTPLLVDVRIPEGSTPDSVFDSPARAATTPPGRPSAPPVDERARVQPHAYAQEHPAPDAVADTEKLANKLLAVLEPGGK